MRKDQQGTRWTDFGWISKYEFRNSNFETISNDQNLNDRNGTEEIFIFHAKGAVLNIRKFEFRICFGFRDSDFGFDHLAPPFTAAPQLQDRTQMTWFLKMKRNYPTQPSQILFRFWNLKRTLSSWAES
jgi:hypothetical protein